MPPLPPDLAGALAAWLHENYPPGAQLLERMPVDELDAIAAWHHDARETPGVSIPTDDDLDAGDAPHGVNVQSEML